MMKSIIATALAVVLHAHIAIAQADSFGSGANEFEIEFVTIGNPGNAPDTTGSPNPAGSVPTKYRIGKYEISEQMIDKANALGGLGITKDSRGPDKPATNITWFEAAKFVNWLNIDAGETPAYKFDGSGVFHVWQPTDFGYDPSNLFRNSQAKYFLPSYDEWYKAAYFDPIAGVYYDFPTGSDNVPDGIDFAGDTEFDAVFLDPAAAGPHDIFDAGVLSPYGTVGQGGNVWEWQETIDFDPTNSSGSGSRVLRGGGWADPFIHMRSSTASSAGAFTQEGVYGFRVAAFVPEPATFLIASLAVVGILSVRIRHANHRVVR